MCLEKSGVRIQEIAQVHSILGENVDLLARVDDVTTDQVREFAQHLFKSPVTYAVLGGDTHGVPSADKVSSHF